MSLIRNKIVEYDTRTKKFFRTSVIQYFIARVHKKALLRTEGNK